MNKTSRIQKKQGGHHLRSQDSQPPLDDTDRNTDRIIKPVHNAERLKQAAEQPENQAPADLQARRAGAYDPVTGKEELPEGLARPRVGPDHKKGF
ncbi:MAG: hypothetical protein ACTHM2_10030 [Afipia sp.]|jgi:hypothetical protein